MSDALVIMKKKCAAFIIMNHLIKLKEKKQKKFRHYWMKHLYQSRSQYGCDELLNILSIDESTGHFNNFVRMSVSDFENLVTMIGPKIKKKETHLRTVIPVKVRLAVTLRFLASGDSYASLQYVFKISKQIISLIIPEVCCALIDALKNFVKVSKMNKVYLFTSVHFLS